MKTLKMLPLLGLLLPLLGFAGTDYYGAASTEAWLEFDSKIEMNSTRSQKVIKEAIDLQISHIIGHFQAVSYINAGGLPGVLGDSYDIKVGKASSKDGAQSVEYKFKGKINFHSKAFKNSNVASLSIRLPLNPSTIYAFGVKNGTNQCTDHHYNSEGDFFYFWDPELPKCPLKGNHPQVLRLKGKLTKIENTKKTYPEYERLYQKDSLKVAVFMGYIDEVIRGRVRTSDDGYRSYKEIKSNLVEDGFKLVDEKKRFSHGKNSYLATLNKTITNTLGRRQDIELKLMLADTELDSRDSSFETHFAEALKTADLVAYDGHSGLGGNLDLGNLPNVGFRNNYQIYYFNGCSTYAYFNSMFFNSKPGGKKNLEIITSGLPTLSSSAVDNMMAFLGPFVAGKVVSYQTLLNNLEKSNGEDGTYLMAVNGDEDNSFRP